MPAGGRKSGSNKPTTHLRYCHRCDYEWHSRVPKPVRCPRCGNRGWSTPAKPGNWWRGGQRKKTAEDYEADRRREQAGGEE